MNIRSSLAIYNRRFECTAALDLIRDGPMGHGFPCGDGSCIDWASAACYYWFFFSLSSGCLVYEVFVATVATVWSGLSLGPALAVRFWLSYPCRSQVEVCGLWSSLTCVFTVLDSPAMIEPYFLGYLTFSCSSTATLLLLLEPGGV